MTRVSRRFEVTFLKELLFFEVCGVPPVANAHCLLPSAILTWIILSVFARHSIRVGTRGCSCS